MSHSFHATQSTLFEFGAGIDDEILRPPPWPIGSACALNLAPPF